MVTLVACHCDRAAMLGAWFAGREINIDHQTRGPKPRGRLASRRLHPLAISRHHRLWRPWRGDAHRLRDGLPGVSGRPHTARLVGHAGVFAVPPCSRSAPTAGQSVDAIGPAEAPQRKVGVRLPRGRRLQRPAHPHRVCRGERLRNRACRLQGHRRGAALALHRAVEGPIGIGSANAAGIRLLLPALQPGERFAFVGKHAQGCTRRALGFRFLRRSC